MFSLPNLVCTAQGTVLFIFAEQKKKKVKTDEKVKCKLKA